MIYFRALMNETELKRDMADYDVSEVSQMNRISFILENLDKYDIQIEYAKSINYGLGKEVFQTSKQIDVDIALDVFNQFEKDNIPPRSLRVGDLIVGNGAIYGIDITTLIDLNNVNENHLKNRDFEEKIQRILGKGVVAIGERLFPLISDVKYRDTFNSDEKINIGVAYWYSQKIKELLGYKEGTMKKALNGDYIPKTLSDYYLEADSKILEEVNYIYKELYNINDQITEIGNKMNLKLQRIKNNIDINDGTPIIRTERIEAESLQDIADDYVDSSFNKYSKDKVLERLAELEGTNVEEILRTGESKFDIDNTNGREDAEKQKKLLQDKMDKLNIHGNVKSFLDMDYENGVEDIEWIILSVSLEVNGNNLDNIDAIGDFLIECHFANEKEFSRSFEIKATLDFSNRDLDKTLIEMNKKAVELTGWDAKEMSEIFANIDSIQGKIKDFKNRGYDKVIIKF